MANALLHDVRTEDAETVETARQLSLAVCTLADGEDHDLDDTYVIERIAETLSDGSIARSIRIRKAERI